MDDNTRKMMQENYNEEAAAHSKYMMYERNARDEGLWSAASLFHTLAGQELEHARMWGERLGEIGDTEQNLRRAAEDEKHDSEKYARQFETTNDPTMKMLSDVEKNHEKELIKSLNALEKGDMYESPSVVPWECMNCGMRTMGRTPPSRCPLCHGGQGCYRNMQ